MTRILGPRRWVGHDADAVAWTEEDGTIAVVRDGMTAAASGRGWVDRPGRPGSYEHLPADVVAFCRLKWPLAGGVP